MDIDWGTSLQILCMCSLWSVFVYLGNCFDQLLPSGEALGRIIGAPNDHST